MEDHIIVAGINAAAFRHSPLSFLRKQSGNRHWGRSPGLTLFNLPSRKMFQWRGWLNMYMSLTVAGTAFVLHEIPF